MRPEFRVHEAGRPVTGLEVMLASIPEIRVRGFLLTRHLLGASQHSTRLKFEYSPSASRSFLYGPAGADVQGLGVLPDLRLRRPPNNRNLMYAVASPMPTYADRNYLSGSAIGASSAAFRAPSRPELRVHVLFAVDLTRTELTCRFNAPEIPERWRLRGPEFLVRQIPRGSALDGISPPSMLEDTCASPPAQV